MSHKITEPIEWYGHETEALLATESSKAVDKELVIVTVVREGKPEAFYRVRGRGKKPADFTNWLEAVDCYNCIG